MEAVRRLEAPERNFFGWVARYRHRGSWAQRYFADDRFGGRDAAFLAARTLQEADPELRVEAIDVARRLRSRLNSEAGVVGVSRVTAPGRPANWMAYWTDAQGKRRFKRFSVGVHGEEEALRLAVEHRTAMTQPDLERLSDLLRLFECSTARPPPVR